MFRVPALQQVKEFADYISTSNAILRLRPYRKTAKSLSNEMTREMPSRSMSAKEVRSTREKSWSGKRSPIAHAASRSALVVCSMVEFSSDRRFPDHSIFLRSDIRYSRRTKIEDDGTVNTSWRLGQILVNQPAHIFGE